MTERIPLFPLGTVLFPGLVLPLHIFEERYRALIQELAGRPPGAARQFGVIAIREGQEVGPDAVRSLYDVGCVAELGQVEAYTDGRFDTVSLGTRRFRLHGLDESLPYLQGDIEEIPETPGEGDVVLATGVRREFREYRSALAGARGGPVSDEEDEAATRELPDDPSVLSYFVAAATVLELADKQRLLAAPDDAERLRLEIELLRREAAVLRVLPSLPAVDLARESYSGN